MKRSAYYYLSFVAIMTGCLVSCQDDDMGYTSEEIARAKFEKEYQENFERDYGKIAVGHTWGFQNSFNTRADGTDPNIIDPYPGVSNQYRLTRNSDGSVNKAAHIGGGGGSDTDILSQYAFQYAPPAITPAEKEYVFKYVHDHPNEGGMTCPMDNYFIQNLGMKEYVYDGYDQNGTRKIDNQHMDKLSFDKVHFESFNQGVGYDYYVSNTEISDPYYENSYNNGNPQTHLENGYYFNGNEVHNAYRYYLIPGYGLYLCFDFATESSNGCFDGDGRYDDWILKISPGLNEKFRVFCEDLGSTLDLDFNDLVFDYAIIPGFNKISIEIKSLGGTLPISIENKDLKGSDLTANLQITNNAGTETLNSNIPVFYIEKTRIEDVIIKVQNSQTGTCFVANVPGKAPYLLRVPANTAWTAENERIEHKYPTFKFYVTDEKQPFWWGDRTNYPDITPGQN